MNDNTGDATTRALALIGDAGRHLAQGEPQSDDARADRAGALAYALWERLAVEVGRAEAVTVVLDIADQLDDDPLEAIAGLVVKAAQRSVRTRTAR